MPEPRSIEGFLKGYRPADDHWTTRAEMTRIQRALRLDGMTQDELIAMRNRVVEYYRGLMENEMRYNADGSFAGRTDKFWDYQQGMMSVTAVIDAYYRRNR